MYNFDVTCRRCGSTKVESGETYDADWPEEPIKSYFKCVDCGIKEVV